jgi:hypothetical protein
MVGYSKMVAAGVPMAIENMDSQKHSGFDRDELVGLVSFLRGSLVFDVQHAYEHEPSMGYASRLLYSLWRSLAYFHVSGESGSGENRNNHSLVCRSDNKGQVLDFLKDALSHLPIRNVPLILEGKYETPEDLREEIRFLTEELIC